MGLRKKLMVIANTLIIVIATMIMVGCASYQFGDLSNVYCTATTPHTKAKAKGLLMAAGVEVGIDYCAAVRVVKGET